MSGAVVTRGPLRFCGRFGWCAGMRTTDGIRVLAVGSDGVPTMWAKIGSLDNALLSIGFGSDAVPWPEWSEPDLLDDATKGALLGLVRQEWRDPLIYVTVQAGGDLVEYEVCRPLVHGSKGIGFDVTEGLALCDALRSAP